MPQVNDLIQLNEELMGIDPGSHKNSPEYDDVMQALHFVTQYQPMYMDHPMEPSIVKLFRGYYDNLHAACQKYLSDKGSSRFSGYGQGRLHCIQEIDRIAEQDMRIFADPDLEKHPKTLSQVFERSRAQAVTVDDPSAIRTVGGQASQRIPLQVLEPSLESTQQGFFTAQSRLETDSLRKRVREIGTSPALADYVKAFSELDMTNNDGLYLSGIQGQLWGMLEVSAPIPKGKTATDREKLEAMQKDPCKFLRDQHSKVSYAAAYLFLDDPLIEGSRSNAFLKTIYSDPEAAKQFLAIAYEQGKVLPIFGVNRKVGAIPAGEEISKRNVAMTRVADLLGAGDLIARAEMMTATVDGKPRKGVFMETVQGTDIERLTADDDLVTHKDSVSLESAHLKRQLSDLQVLDYICGNVDRHTGNMLYHTEIRDGKAVITGVTGIDNDLSFGVISGSDREKRNSFVTPDRMRVMRQSTADAVLGLNRDTLEQQLKDLDFTKEEMDAAWDRVQKLQDQIRMDIRYFKSDDSLLFEKGRIRVLPDEAFAHVPMEDFYTSDQGNYFSGVSHKMEGIPKVKASDVREHKDIPYASATGQKYEDERPIKYGNVENAAKSLADLGKMMKDADSIFHHDSGSYKWMKQSYERLQEKLEQLAAEKKDPTEELSDDDVRELDTLYRDLNRAANSYLKEHPGERRTDLGQTRQDLARAMVGLKAPHGEALGIQTKIRVGRKAVEAEEKMSKKQDPSATASKKQSKKPARTSSRKKTAEAGPTPPRRAAD